ncbi:MAG TPA: T9SS type A sorting domain-containing protein [Flavisolibacter sp.]|jgi:hypothetical protein|nr:T9SS type A sorting domain-containing protein [Flavisolibacter sp.]
MNKLLPFFFFFLTAYANAQITTPVIKAGFGVDGDLRSNYYNNFATSGNDDWFTAGGIGGTWVIDTTGAAAIVAGYTSDVSPFPRRTASFYRTMRVAPYTVVNNRLWLDALYVRDFHGADQTVFVQGSSKNGMSPAEWGGTIQSVPDKNEILDVMMHLRRAGDGKDPNRTDSLWMYGGISIENTSGNRYFDFELYQTDIYYDLTSQKFYGYGPDAGHTSWKFDAAGNILQAGDIIFSATYQSGGLSGVEARLWIDKASMNITPVGFNWTGVFDGASSGAQYGYAAITPNKSGYFYTGLENSRTAWAGPFKLVRADNSVMDDYATGQFMEFSVNLTHLGIDPATLLGGDVCGTPFNRMIVKTRSSEAFTSALKDFVAPIDLFLAPRVDAATDVPLYCGSMGVSELRVLNASPSSVYTWTTPNGSIVGANEGPQVTANAPGTYIVTQQLAEGCKVYAADTLQIIYDAACTTLESGPVEIRAEMKESKPQINWTSFINDRVVYYELETSLDGSVFRFLHRFENKDIRTGTLSYQYGDKPIAQATVYYRVKLVTASGILYSRVASVQSTQKLAIQFAPNPASYHTRVSFASGQNQRVRISVFSLSGKRVFEQAYQATKGINTITIDDVQNWPAGIYMAQVQMGTAVQWQKIVVQRGQ